MKLKETIIDEIKDFINPYIGKLFPGCVFGCANSKNQFSLACGTKNSFGPMATSNLFDVASVTKAILHVITLKMIPLSELDQKIVTLLPMSGKYRDQITVKHLLTFGVEYGDQVRLSQISDRDEMLTRICNGDLPIAPGTTYRYTNISSMLLTLFLEKKLDRKFDNMVQDFCDDIGMKTTGFHPRRMKSLEDMVLTEQGLGPGIIQDESARLYGVPTGSAGIFSTIDDMLIFGQSFLGSAPYLPKEIIALMPTSQFASSFAMTFGLGMGLRHQNECDLTDDNGFPLVVLKKNGFSGIHFCVLPENDFCFVVFGNICYPERPSAESRDQFTSFHKKLLRILYESRSSLL